MSRLIHENTPREYFRELVEKALRRQNLESSGLSSFYLVHLLDSFVRPDGIYDSLGVGEDPRLAELLCQALKASGRRRLALLKLTGDRSLFISGFFCDSLEGKLVDAGYYVQMGGYAYGRLARLAASRAAAEVFAELSGNFVRFVDVLNEVSEAASLTDSRSLLRLYERWLRTGSEKSAERLKEQGVLLVPGSKNVH